MSTKKHWEEIYESKAPEDVSWFQRQPTISLDLIRRVAPRTDAAIIDVGGGASTLVDSLLSQGYSRVTVSDISAAALRHARSRLGAAAASVTWRCADVLDDDLPAGAFDVWHDRAVFHFLTSRADRQRYVAQVERAVRPNGHVIVATFAENGPRRCSGLKVVRYSARELHAAFGARFELIDTIREEHLTPGGTTQAFQYCLCAYRSAAVTAA